jgi:hypothetical protein
MKRFYVYEHRRLDTGAVFYVGKGAGMRARVTFNRNQYWRRVADKHGFDVRVVCRTADEDLAFLAEMELIDLHRRIGSPLTNMTDGGEGTAGYKRSAESIERGASKLRGRKRPDISERLAGVPKSDDHRRKLSAVRAGSRASDATRAKMSAIRKGRPSTMLGKKHRPESIEKIRAAVGGDKAPFLGRKHTAESKAKMSAAHRGRRDSEETRRRKSAARSGSKNPLFGVAVDEARKEKQRQTLLATIAANRMECEHCGKIVDPANFRRWHGDRCRVVAL